MIAAREARMSLGGMGAHRVPFRMPSASTSLLLGLGAFMAMFVEGAWRGAMPEAALVAGAAIFLAAKALKWWAIVSLGQFWTFRVIVIPGARLVAAGPYRWMRHPNYAGVMGELAGVALMTGAEVSGLAGIVTFGALVFRRIATEERALQKATR